MATEKHAQVTWKGDLETGSGTIESVGSGVLGPLPVSWAARIGEKDRMTSPDELLAAAHAACFSMALSNGLAKAGTPPDALEVSATVTFVPGTGITRSVLDVRGDVPGIDDGTFRDAAEQAKENCPISKALRGNVELSVTSRL